MAQKSVCVAIMSSCLIFKVLLEFSSVFMQASIRKINLCMKYLLHYTHARGYLYTFILSTLVHYTVVLVLSYEAC